MGGPSHDHGPSAHGHDAVCGHNINESRTLWAACLTGGFMVVEVFGGVISGSLALIADAGHMFTDFGSLLLAWFGFRMARQPADDHRTYGFHRFQVLAAFTNGITLIFIALWILVEAIGRFINPVEVQASTMMAVAIVGLGINGLVFMLLHGADRDNLNVRGALIHVIGDLLGSVAAIGAAVVILVTEWMPIDPLLSLLVAGLILRSAWGVVARSGHILLEGAPGHIDVRKISADLVARFPGLHAVHHVHVWCLTQDRILATLHARTDAQTDTNHLVAAIRDHLNTAYGIGHVTVEIERD